MAATLNYKVVVGSHKQAVFPYLVNICVLDPRGQPQLLEVICSECHGFFLILEDVPALLKECQVDLDGVLGLQ